MFPCKTKQLVCKTCKLTIKKRERKPNGAIKIKNGGVMVFNATFNKISVLSWLSILFPDLVEETGVPGNNH